MSIFRCLRILTILFVICNAQPASAAFLNPDPVWVYVDPETLPATLLPPPPVENSPANRAQIRAVVAAQKHVSQSDLMAMRDEQHIRLELMTKILGPDFTRDQRPKAFALLDRVWGDTRLVTDQDKNFWHTRRPYLVDRYVKLRIDPIDNSPAYPSGHTCASRVVAEILGMIEPTRLADLRVQADAIAWHRVEAGVHYPVDLDGGRMLAMQIIGALMQNDAFLDDLADAQAEDQALVQSR